MTEAEMTEVETPVEPAEKVIVRGIKGTVKWFSLYNHYGFINRADNGKDVFVHISGIIQRGKTRFALDVEQEVEMDVSSGLKGEKAIAVTLPGGLPIENTRIIRFNRRGGNRRSKGDEMETADEGEQPNQEDSRQAATENKTEGRGNKRQKKRTARRRRNSIATGEEQDGVQAGGDAEKNGGSWGKPEEPKSEADSKKDSEAKATRKQSVSGGDKTADAKKDADKSKPQEPATKKEAIPAEKSKPEEAKPVTVAKQSTVAELKNKLEGEKAAKPEEKKHQSLGQSLIDGVHKMLGTTEDGDASKDDAKFNKE